MPSRDKDKDAYRPGTDWVTRDTKTEVAKAGVHAWKLSLENFPGRIGARTIKEEALFNQWEVKTMKPSGSVTPLDNKVIMVFTLSERLLKPQDTDDGHWWGMCRFR